jgi:hypothetical protein
MDESGFSFDKRGKNLDVAAIETSKDKIEQPDFAKDENMYIPPLGSSVIMSGKSGCGKSTLLANLITDSRFYGPSPKKPHGWFDKIFLFSPTANGDDVQRSLNIPKEHVFTDLDEVPDLLALILDSQQDKLDDGAGADKVAQFALIFDDIIGDTKFMNEKAFSRCFYQVRHVNCTTFICAQHFRKIPKLCRMQANFIFFFQGSGAEVEMITEEFSPPLYKKKEFINLVTEATREPFNFLTINMKVPWEKRFRRNLDDFVTLERLASEKNMDKEPNSNDGRPTSSSREGVNGPGDRQSTAYTDRKDGAGRNPRGRAVTRRGESIRHSPGFPPQRR